MPRQPATRGAQTSKIVVPNPVGLAPEARPRLPPCAGTEPFIGAAGTETSTAAAGTEGAA